MGDLTPARHSAEANGAERADRAAKGIEAASYREVALTFLACAALPKSTAGGDGAARRKALMIISAGGDAPGAFRHIEA